MADTEDSRKEVFTFYWNIENLRFNVLENGECITSPKFSLPNFEDTVWYLILYPNGETKTALNCVSLFLNRENDEGPETIQIEYMLELRFCTLKKSFVEHSFKKTEGHGWSKFLEHLGSNFLHEDSFVIMCRMRFNGSTEAFFSENSLPSILKSDTQCIKLTVDRLKVYSDTESLKVKEKLYAWPKQSTALSHLCTQINTLEWSVDKSVVEEDEYSEMIPVLFPQINYSLMVTLTKKSQEFITADIMLMDGDFEKFLLVKCRLSLVINETESMLMFEQKYEFSKRDNDIWCVEEALKISDLKTKLMDILPGMSKLKFEFTFANGEVHSRILEESSSSITCDMDSVHSSFFSRQMFRFYNEKVLCDVVLKVKNNNIPAHKVVLSMLSPVFSAMFSNEMKETECGTVDIEDLDEDIVSDMLSFLYTGTVKNLDFEKALKLFSAADKYQIVLLKNKCRKVLMEKLNYENIIQILHLADLHGDMKLKSTAVEIICLDKKKVLFLDGWKELVQENKNLVIEILQKVCLKGN